MYKLFLYGILVIRIQRHEVTNVLNYTCKKLFPGKSSGVQLPVPHVGLQ